MKTCCPRERIAYELEVITRLIEINISGEGRI